MRPLILTKSPIYTPLLALPLGSGVSKSIRINVPATVEYDAHKSALDWDIATIFIGLGTGSGFHVSLSFAYNEAVANIWLPLR